MSEKTYRERVAAISYQLTTDGPKDVLWIEAKPVYALTAEADAEIAALKASVPGFSPMWFAPIDGTSVLLYMPTCGHKFAVGMFHADSPDSICGHWGDDEGSFFSHQPVAFMALSNLSRLLGSHALAAHLKGTE